MCKVVSGKIYLKHGGFVTSNFLFLGKLYSVTLKTTSRKTSHGGYWEVSSTARASPKHGDVELRFDYSCVTYYQLLKS